MASRTFASRRLADRYIAACVADGTFERVRWTTRGVKVYSRRP